MFTTLKTAVLAPMPSAIITTASAAKPGLRRKCANGCAHVKARADSLLGVVLMRHWIPQVHQRGLANATTNESIESADDGAHVAVICANDVAPVIRFHATHACDCLEQQFAR